MNPLWRAHRAVVDRARAGVRRWQDRTPSPHPAPVSASWDPRVLAGLIQPDNNTCGSASLVAMKMLRHPGYAELMLSAPDPQGVFAQATLGVLRTTNAGRDRSGRRQLPWPQIGGTRPAAMIRLLHSDEGFARPGVRYRNVVVDPADPTPVFEAITATVSGGEPVPLYVGDHRWMQHIVLAVGAEDRRLVAYNPAHGGFDVIEQAEFTRDEISVGPWTRPWLAILPR